ncbi:33789_t:CDS:2 [Racocetra persica]|uniref:33789_t:CDS:1 n=1 Tax=Racocetra persica TaxID=160502 RepID=A0ACA9KA05_9GLOM|nr:33789_t:CDS:2 [Racocetra persica]
MMVILIMNSVYGGHLNHELSSWCHLNYKLSSQWSSIVNLVHSGYLNRELMIISMVNSVHGDHLNHELSSWCPIMNSVYSGHQS